MEQEPVLATKSGHRPWSKRWLVIIGGVLFQVALLATLLLIGRMPDITLAPVAGDPTLCRVVSVAPLSDAQIRGVTPGMLVRPLRPPRNSPLRPGYRLPPGQIRNCQLVSGSALVQVMGRGQGIPLLVTRSVPPPDLTNIIFGTLLAIIFQLAGALIFLRAQKRPTARVAYALFYVFSLFCLIFNSGTTNRSWEFLFLFLLTVLTGGLSTTFVCLFPSPRQASARAARKVVGWRRVLTLLPYLPLFSALGLACFGVPLFFAGPQHRFPMMTWSGFFSIACLLVVIGTLVWGLRHLDQYERQFARIISASMAFLLFPMILYTGIFQPGPPIHDSVLRLIPLPLLVLPIICDYALFRHQLIGTTSLVTRQVTRVLLWILLACLFIFPIIFLQRSLENSTLLPESVRDYLYAGLLALSLWLFPLAWHKVRDVGDHVFYRDFYQYNRSLRELSTALTRLQGLDQISAFILPRLAQLLNTSDVILLIRAISLDEMGYWPELHKSSTRDWHMYRHTVGAVGVSEERLRRIADLGLIHLEQRSHEPLLLDDVLLLTLYDGNRVSGFLCLGPKNNREPYSRQDRSFLATLAAQLSVLEVNNRYLLQARLDAQKVTALNRRVISAQEDERRHLALDLHDDVLQQAMLLVRQLSDAGTMNDVADAMPLARGVVQNLRRTCLALRPTLLDELGLADALGWLANQTEQFSGGNLRVALDCTSFSGKRASSAVELAFYRVAQEALTNVLKHADASSVILRLRDVMQHEPDGVYRSLTLVIADNGRGARLARPLASNLGMVGMHERMAAVGGHIRARSRPGCGFIVRATCREALMVHDGTQGLDLALRHPEPDRRQEALSEMQQPAVQPGSAS